MAATKEQYEKIFGKVSDAQWAQIQAIHAAPKSAIPPLAQLSTTPGAPGVTAYRMGEASRALDSDRLARARAFYLGSEGPQGALETLQYGKTAPTLEGAAAAQSLPDGAPVVVPPPAPAPVVMRGGPAATPEQQALAAAHSPVGMVREKPAPLTAVQDPGNMEPFVEPETYPMVKPVAMPVPVMKPGGYAKKPPVVTLAPIEETVIVPKKKGKKEEPASPPTAFKMPMEGDAPVEAWIPPGKVKG